jgi:hypothetical protein
MVSLTADGTVLLKDVGMFVEPVEIYDATGKFLGLFVPANLERGKEMYARAVAQTDWAEIERRKRSNDELIPLRDTLTHLKMLETEMERRKAAGEKEFTTAEALAYFQSLQQPGPLRVG